MRHSLTVACSRFRLRPVTLDDAAFIVHLRSNPSLNRYLHGISSRLEDQIAWIECYFERPHDYYFIVEEVESGEPHGAIGIYEIKSDTAEWGRWILKPGSMAALESAWLIYEAGFANLGLARMFARTLAENPKVVSFHDSFGASRNGILKDHFSINGEPKSAIEHQVVAAEWPDLRAHHYSTAFRMSRHVQR
jgi:RimJ/RimL family protein N-acetyltransferase